MQTRFPFSTEKLLVHGRELIIQNADQSLHRPDIGQIVADFALAFAKKVEFRGDFAARYHPEGYGEQVYLDKEIRANCQTFAQLPVAIKNANRTAALKPL